MAHYKFTNGARVKNADSWTFQTNPYITARPQIHCVGDECKKSEISVYYQYGNMEVNPPEFIQFIPLIVIFVILIVVGVLFLYKRAKANKEYDESMLSRMDNIRAREYIDTF